MGNVRKGAVTEPQPLPGLAAPHGQAGADGVAELALGHAVASGSSRASKFQVLLAHGPHQRPPA